MSGTASQKECLRCWRPRLRVSEMPALVTNFCENCKLSWAVYDTGEVWVADEVDKLDTKIDDGCLFIAHGELIVPCLRCGVGESCLIQIGDIEEDVVWSCERCGFEWNVSGNLVQPYYGWVNKDKSIETFRVPEGTLLVMSEEP